MALDLRPGLVSIGPILPAIRAQFALSHTEAALLTSIPDLLLGLLALPTPRLAWRFGGDTTIISALVLLGVAMEARALAPDTASLLLATAGVGAGIAIAGALIGTVIKASFPTRAAFVMSIYATALSGGSTLAAALTGPILREAGGWKPAAGAWGVLSVAAIAAWTVFVRRTAAVATLGAAPPPVRHDLPWRNRIAWRIALYFGGVNLLFYSPVSWMAPLFEERGLSVTQAGLVLASFTLAFTVATPVFGLLSRSEDRRSLLAVSACLAVAGLAAMAAFPSMSPFIYVPIIAAGGGGAFTLSMTLPLDNTDSADEATAWNAFVLVVGYLIAAAGPLTMGALRDATGGFTASIIMLLAVSVGMLALTPFLLPYARCPAPLS